MPSGVDATALATYCLMLADDALVLAQRLAEWTTHAPEIEEEVALANIGLDLLGQARLLLARAAAADPDVVPIFPKGSPVPADDRLAYFRDAGAFRNVELVEQPNGDFAATMARLLVFSAWRLALLEHLRASADPVLAAVAEKGVKEVRYHREHAARWCITLAQGTEVSRERMIAGLREVWPDVAELARCDVNDDSRVAADHAALRRRHAGRRPGARGRRPGTSRRPTAPEVGDATAAHRRASASSSPRCRASRASTRWAGGDSAGT